jgi:hypothetical protein
LAQRTRALEIAARNDHAEAAAMLIVHGAVLNKVSQATGVYSFGALQFAALHGSCRSAAVLVHARADLDQMCVAHEARWMGTAASAAATKGHAHMLAFAAAAGANVHTCIGSTYLTAVSRTRRTPLHAAAVDGHVNVVEYLLSVKVSANVRVPDLLETPLQVAAYRGHALVVKALLAAKASTKPKRAHDEFSALCLASNPLLLDACRLDACALDIVKQLVAAGADVNSVCKSGWTALMCAASGGHVAIVVRLLQARACVNTRTPNRSSALDFPAVHRSQQLANVLLRAKATVEEHTDVGKQTSTLLAAAAATATTATTAATAALCVRETRNCT